MKTGVAAALLARRDKSTGRRSDKRSFRILGPLPPSKIDPESDRANGTKHYKHMNQNVLFLRFLWVICLGTVTHISNLAAAPALELRRNERIAFVGNSLAERMSLFGYFEALLHARFPQHQLVVRNFARPADEVARQQRPNDYSKLDDPLEVFGPDTFLCFFGFNESFAGLEGVEKFKDDYEKFLDDYARKYGGTGPATRFVLISPIAFENQAGPFFPDGAAENVNLGHYAKAVAAVARKRSLVFADIFTPTLEIFNATPGAQFTINGAHINEAGDHEVARLLDAALFGGENPAKVGSARFHHLREAVNDKSWVHMQDYRMLNGWYVYGGRRAPYDTETFPEEYKKIRQMVAVRDHYVWDIAQGKTVSAAPDDSGTLQLAVPKTAFGTKKYSEPPELRYLEAEEAIKEMTTPPAFEVKLFASEEMFRELAKPVQIDFDNKGRLWAACMPTYPQWKPGDARPSDRLLIFEDTDNDGRADKCKVFYDRLHCSTSFEFWNGGVLVVSQPRILFLKDTDGDDRADEVVEWLDGLASDDTHHRGGFEWSHGGLLHHLEGVSMSTTLETPWGPFRNKNTPGAYVIDPRSQKIRHFITPGFGNGWCYVFDRWGQGIVGDGTGAQQLWESPLSGAEKGQRKGLNPIFNNGGMRPAVGSDFLYSRHFPDDVQGQFVYACVINMNGIPRFEVHDEGSGFGGKRLADLLKSTDKNFRPTDPKIGPDGALWFGDWHNPLIGHMQYSQRDPNRDHTRGRIYRLVAKDRPLLQPVTQFGKSIPELLDQLKEYEPRTRYRARRELRDRPTPDVLKAIKSWTAKLDTNDANREQYLCEALWIQQSHHAVDIALLKQLLQANSFQARAAATRALADEWDRIPNALGLLHPLVNDDHPRVRLEVVRALSFVPATESVDLALEVARKPLDYYLEYTLQHTLGALEPQWKESFTRGEIAKNNPDGQEFLTAFATGRPQLGAIARELKRLIDSEIRPRDRDKAIDLLASARGQAGEGKLVFDRVCVACHKIGDTGADFGPDLSKVGERLKRNEIVESILYPNEKLDPKYLATNITSKEGDEFSGLVTAEDEQNLTLVLGAGIKEVIRKDNIAKREALKVSSMPEGLAAGLAPQEFVDLIEYLSSLK